MLVIHRVAINTPVTIQQLSEIYGIGEKAIEKILERDPYSTFLKRTQDGLVIRTENIDIYQKLADLKVGDQLTINSKLYTIANNRGPFWVLQDERGKLWKFSLQEIIDALSSIQ